MLRHIVFATLALTSGAALTPQPGRELIQAMRDRYIGQWYRTLTFVQQNTATGPDGKVEHSVWREYAALPSRLRIEFEPASQGKGYLFVRDSEYDFDADTLARATPLVHPLMVLGFDVYLQPVERTLTQLQQLGVDLGTLREDSLDGRAVYVVGARAGDLHSLQFWVDKERLLFVRMLQPGRRDTTLTADTRFNKYQRQGKAWVSAEVQFLVNGHERWLEQYTEIKTDVPLADALFDARQWKRLRR
ncbi:MAG TPA: hypothetical protein VH116_06050 [Gemmatimonadales bacterium]|nr:hypothetical protein [Gemmatimonadales bacterium]